MRLAPSSLRSDPRCRPHAVSDTSGRVTIRAICGSPFSFHQAKARRARVHDTHPFAADLAQPVGDRQPAYVRHELAVLEAIVGSGADDTGQRALGACAACTGPLESAIGS